jgi:hypothetical protein
MRSAFNHGYLTDGKMVLMAKVCAEVLVGNSAMLLALLLVLLALFFVSSFFFVPVLVLGKGTNRPSQQERSTNGADYRESFRDEPRLGFVPNVGRTHARPRHNPR